MKKTILVLSALILTSVSLIGCGKGKDSKDAVVTVESTVSSARSVGVEIKLEEFWADRGDGYGAYFLKLKYIDTSAVGPTDGELVAAINALRSFDSTLDSERWKQSDRDSARSEVRYTIAKLQEKRTELLKNRN